MKFVTFLSPAHPNELRLGLLDHDFVIDLAEADPLLPSDIITFLRLGEGGMERARAILKGKSGSSYRMIPYKVVTLLAPIPRPTSMRDGYAFRQHVEAARRNRGVEMIPEFDAFPVFYFTNHQAVI